MGVYFFIKKKKKKKHVGFIFFGSKSILLRWILLFWFIFPPCKVILPSRKRNYYQVYLLLKFGRSPYTILGKYCQRGLVYIIYIYMPPLAVSPSQIYFEISNIQAITVSLALEVAPVQKQCMYVRTITVKSNKKIIIKCTQK